MVSTHNRSLNGAPPDDPGMSDRDTTPEMATRVVTAIETRLAVVLEVAGRETAGGER
jgi:hypothetical protein